MRNSYSLLSQEINDKLLLAYDNLIELLGFEKEGQTHYSGILEQIDSSGTAYVISPSGLPSSINQRVLTILKFDYIYRTHYNQIRYLENNNG